MPAPFVRLALAGALLTACGGASEAAPTPDAASNDPADASPPHDARASDSDYDAAPRADAAPADACTDCLADAAADADADAHTDAASPAPDAEAPLVFVPSYGPCPAPLACDALMAFIAQPLILKAYPDAPSNVSACVPPNLPFPAVPACYEEGPCPIGDEVGICLGREEPHPNTGYCLKPCR